MPSLLGSVEPPVPCARCLQQTPGLKWGDLCADCQAELRRRASPLARGISLLAAPGAGVRPVTLSEGRLSFLSHALLKAVGAEKLGTVRNERLFLNETKRALSDGFDLDKIGSQYNGFTSFSVVGGHWTVSGSGGAWVVSRVSLRATGS